MDTLRICQSCGSPLPADAPQGLCPKCIARVGLGSEAGTPTMPPAPPGGQRAEPPTPAEMSKHFPQLEILELLGEGGMGVVYKARQPKLDRIVALKILSAECSRDPAFAERFQREARALAKLNHPAIVAVYDFGQSDGLYYFLMEYVDGVNLRQALDGKQLASRDALGVVTQICDALQYAHDEGVVHRDIKPGNVLLDKRGRVKIADFGLAKLMGKAAGDQKLTQSRVVMGTPHYMAPEQLERPLEVDHRADIYSLGVVFYEMLTGELPIGRFSPPSQRVQMDVRLDEVVLRTLEKEPARRYQHASDVKTDVESISGRNQPAPPRDTRGPAFTKCSLRFSESQGDNASLLTHATGVLRLEEDRLVIEFQFKDSLLGVFKFALKELHIPYGELTSIRLIPRSIWSWKDRLTLTAGKMSTLADLPTCENGQVTLTVVDEDKAAAKRFVEISQERLATFQGRPTTHMAGAASEAKTEVVTITKSYNPLDQFLFLGEAPVKGRRPTGILLFCFVVFLASFLPWLPYSNETAWTTWMRHHGILVYNWWYITAAAFVAFLAVLRTLGILRTRLWIPLVSLSAILLLAVYLNTIQGGRGGLAFGPILALVAFIGVIASDLKERNAFARMSASHEPAATTNVQVEAGETSAVPPRNMTRGNFMARIPRIARAGIGFAILAVAVVLLREAWKTVTSRTSAEQPIFYTFAGVTPFVKSPDGPVFGRSAIVKLGMTAAQAVEVNKIIPRYYKDFLALERRNTKASKDAQGRIHITISPFYEETLALAEKLAAELHGIVGKDILYPKLPGNLLHFGLFRHAGMGSVTAELWKDGDTYHFNEVIGPHGLPNDKDGGASRGNQGVDHKFVFPEEYWIYWEEKTPTSVPSSRPRVPIIYQLDGDTGFEKGPSGPELRAAAIRKMGLTRSQVGKVNGIFGRYHREYQSIVRQHTTSTNDSNGHMHVTISPFRDTLVALQVRMVAELRKAIGRDIINPREPQNPGDGTDILNSSVPEEFPLFGHRGVTKMTIEFWKDNDTYHIAERRYPYDFKYKNNIGSVSHGSGGYSTESKDWKEILPEELWSLWGGK
jgi:serine/threonine protein kinase